MHFTVTAYDWVMRQLYIQLPLFLLSVFTFFAILQSCIYFLQMHFCFHNTVMFTSAC